MFTSRCAIGNDFGIEKNLLIQSTIKNYFLRKFLEEYYKQVLSKVDIEELLKDEKDPILLCYEKGQDFCHRHVLAEYIEMKYGIKVRDIKIDKDLNIVENQRPGYIRTILEDVISKEQER